VRTHRFKWGLTGFCKAISKARANAGPSANPTNHKLDSSVTLLRMECHPQYPHSSSLQHAWQNAMAMMLPVCDPTDSLAPIPSGYTKECIGLRRMIVCCSRPSHLSDLLSNRDLLLNLPPPPGLIVLQLEPSRAIYVNVPIRVFSTVGSCALVFM
jgi:hypothetical protein